MRKLIAKTIEGREYVHSRKSCFFAERNAKAICDALNAEKYNLNSGEKWHVYDYDFSQALYCSRKITINRDKTRLRVYAV